MANEDLVRVKITHPRNVNAGRQILGADTEYDLDQETAAMLVRQEKAVVVKGKIKQKDPVVNAGRLTNQEFMTFIQRNATEIYGILAAEADKFPTTPQENEESAGENEDNQTSDEGSEETETSDDEDPGDSEGNETGDESDGTEIPEDFPGKEVLAKNGITTLEAIPRDKEKLMELDQMTGRVANQIGVKLGE